MVNGSSYTWPTDPEGRTGIVLELGHPVLQNPIGVSRRRLNIISLSGDKNPGPSAFQVCGWDTGGAVGMVGGVEGRVLAE